MMLFLIENCAITYSFKADAVDPEIGLDLLAQTLLDFLLTGEIHVRIEAEVSR
jgi:hypothetical protein